MYPHIHIGPLHIPGFALMVGIGIAAFFLWTLTVLIKIEHKDRRYVLKILAIAALSLGALFLSALLLNSLFHSIKQGYPVLGGITWEGGVLGGLTAFLLLTRILVKSERGNEVRLLSALMPGLVLAHGFGRVGCFFGGCCFGRLTESPLGVCFPTGSPAAALYPNTLTGSGSFPVLPTQLFEAVFELLLFLLMLLLYKRLCHHYLSLYLTAYGIFRFVLEFWRGDNRGATGLPISPSQLMSIVLVGWGVVLLLRHHGWLKAVGRRRRMPPPTPPPRKHAKEHIRK